ncbi:hypothetical protein ACV3V0_15910 [Clostridium perfringens]
MFNIPYLDYELLEKEQRKENIDILLDNLDDKQLKVKIINFSDKYDLSPGMVLQKIIDDYVFALCFTKDPLKQTMHQKKAATFIENLPLVSNFRVLPANGAESVFVVNGNLIKKKDLTAETDVKSIDFYWEYTYKGKILKFYATHKYTRGDGGAQYNQYDDVLKFLKHALPCTSENICFFAITDGPYYTSLHENSTKIDYMRNFCLGNRSEVMNINELLYFVAIKIKQWLEFNGFTENNDLYLINDILTSYNIKN